MKKICSLLLALFIGIITSNAQNYQWAKSIGGTSGDYGLSIAVDGSGNIYTTGHFQGTADFNPGTGTSILTSSGDRDIFILKLDSAGNFIWARSIGGTSSDFGWSIAVDGAGNVYTIGSFEGTVDFDPGTGNTNLIAGGQADIFILKLDSAGNFSWAKRIGGPSRDVGNSIAVDRFGNVYTTGYFEGAVDFDPGTGTSNLTATGGLDIFISKLDSTGNFGWAKSMGGTFYDTGNSITVDDFGNAYTTGGFGGTADFDPGAGTSNLTSTGIDDIFISKLDAAGNFIWAKSMGGTSRDVGNSIAVDGSGNVYTTGRFTRTVDFDPGTGANNLTAVGSDDIFILKLNTTGNFRWAKSMGGFSTDGGTSIALDGSSNLYTTGYFQGTADFNSGTGTTNLTSTGNRDVFISRLDAAGNFGWAKSMGGISNDGGNSITVDSLGNVFTTGSFQGVVDFDPGTGTSNLTSTGDFDTFISKLGSATVGIVENNFENTLNAYPNPTSGALSIELSASYEELSVIIRNQIGQTVSRKFYRSTNLLPIEITGESGLYFIEVISDNKKAVFKVVKE